MIRRLAVLAVAVGFAAVVAFRLPDWALLGLGVLTLGVWFSLVRKEWNA